MSTTYSEASSLASPSDGSGAPSASRWIFADLKLPEVAHIIKNLLAHEILNTILEPIPGHTL